MTQVEILDAARDRVGGYKIHMSRGERIGRVSSEWLCGRLTSATYR